MHGTTFDSISLALCSERNSAQDDQCSRGGLKLMQRSFVRNGVVGVEVLPVGSDPIF